VSALTLFNFNGAEIRTTTRDGAPWFVAADVCRVLDLSNPRKAVSGLDDDEKLTVTNSDGRAGQGAQSLNIINESGLYSLVLRSRKPEAKAFKKWVTSEVLPQIRNAGYYVDPAILKSLSDTVNSLSARLDARDRAQAIAESAAKQALKMIKPASELGQGDRFTLIRAYYRSGKKQLKRALRFHSLQVQAAQLELALLDNEYSQAKLAEGI
jgi:prophage antirepressor-like protein